jgi:uncharacterized protein YjdB
MAAPVTGSISGTSPICNGSTTTVTDAAGGGTWSSDDATVASIDAAGVVYGTSVGTATLSYSVTNACATYAATFAMTVIDVPSVPGITGVTTVCEAATTSLGNAVSGGTWSSSATGTATIDIAGVVTGVVAGTATITYSVTNACGTTDVTTTVTVDPLPVAAPITGATTVCAGSTTTLSDATAGGTWSSSDVTVATVDAAGVVTGVSEAPVTITYSVTNSCGTADSIFLMNITDVPVVASITGSSSVCPGTTTTLSDATTGGTWSTSAASVASIDATGLVTGVTTGSATISYAVTNVCGTTTISTSMMVNPLPDAGVITGSTTACVGATTTLSDTAIGGSWSSGDNTIATIDAATGVVTGVAIGSVTITYDLTTGCGTSLATTTISVGTTPVVGAISGSSSFCAGVGVTLADTSTGGVWSSADTTIATVDAAGNVIGIAGGTVNISYSVTNTCGTASAVFPVTVNPLPVVGAITGSAAVCVGGVTTLADTTVGGVWTSSAATIASVDATGNVHGVATGTADITYTVTTGFGCSAYVTTAITVNPTPVLSAISGSSAVAVGSTITLTDTAAGGVWSSSATSIATVNSATGVVRGMASGTVVITYTVTNASGCSAYVTKTITVGGALSTAFVYPGGAQTLCHGNPVVLAVISSDTATLTYQWYYNGVPVAGATDSSYNADSIGYWTCMINTTSGSAMLTGTNIIAPPNPVIGVTGSFLLFTGSYSSYQWMFNGVLIPGATSSVQPEIGVGYYNVIVTDANGCSDTSAAFVDTNWGVGVVEVQNVEVKIFPNPASSTIFVESHSKVNVSVMTADGKVLIRKDNATSVDISELSGGMYMLMVYDQYNMLLKAEKFIKTE